jgi:transposase
MIRCGNVQVWLASDPVDMRRSFDSLAEHVRAFLGQDPLCGNLFVFRSRNGQKAKILWFDRHEGQASGSGLAIYYKRLEKGTFPFPATDQRSLAISSAQLMRLLAGLEINTPQ